MSKDDWQKDTGFGAMALPTGSGFSELWVKDFRTKFGGNWVAIAKKSSIFGTNFVGFRTGKIWNWS